MRTLLKITVDVNAGNKAVIDGTLGTTIQNLIQTLKPEADYYFSENGTRAAYIFFDMKDVSDIPVIAEPLFIQFNAKVEFIPAMNGVDLKKGLDRWAKTAKPEFAHN